MQKFQCPHIKLGLAPALQKIVLPASQETAFDWKPLQLAEKLYQSELTARWKILLWCQCLGIHSGRNLVSRFLLDFSWFKWVATHPAAGHLPSQRKAKPLRTPHSEPSQSPCAAPIARLTLLDITGNTLWLQKLFQTNKQIAKRCATNSSNMMPEYFRTHLKAAFWNMRTRIQGITSSMWD